MMPPPQLVIQPKIGPQIQRGSSFASTATPTPTTVYVPSPSASTIALVVSAVWLMDPKHFL